MFHSLRARLAMRRWKNSSVGDRRDSPRYAIPLSILDDQGKYQDHYGKLGINGFYFETTDIPMIGENVRIRVGLLGLGIEVETFGKVVSVNSASGHVGVIARFDDIEFETERSIARWLDLMKSADNQATS